MSAVLALVGYSRNVFQRPTISNFWFSEHILWKAIKQPWLLSTLGGQKSKQVPKPDLWRSTWQHTGKIKQMPLTRSLNTHPLHQRLQGIMPPQGKSITATKTHFLQSLTCRHGFCQGLRAPVANTVATGDTTEHVIKDEKCCALHPLLSIQL